MIRKFAMVGVVTACFVNAGAQTQQEAPHAATRQIFSRHVPAAGVSLRVSLIEVTYPPGGASPVHSHGCPVLGYVESGALRMRVRGEPERICKAGESFYEAANGIHEISANASQTEPASFLAYFVCDGDQPLTSDVSAHHGLENK